MWLKISSARDFCKRFRRLTEAYLYDILGSGIEIRAPRAVGNYLRRLLAGFVSDLPGKSHDVVTFSVERSDVGGYELRGSRGVILKSLPILEVINGLLAELNRLAIAGLNALAVHAGVVGVGLEVIAFPGPSGAGKSTLTAACLRSGFDYWSDEALILSPDGSVEPYLRPISLSEKSRHLLGLQSPGEGGSEMLVTAADLGANDAAGSGSLRHLVSLTRRAGFPEIVSRPRRLAVRAILNNAFNHYRQPEESFRRAVLAAEECSYWELAYDDPLDAAACLRDRLPSATSPALAKGQGGGGGAGA